MNWQDTDRRRKSTDTSKQNIIA